MKRILLILLASLGTLQAAAPEELKLLDNLIEVTEENLKKQKDLKVQVEVYLKNLDLYLQNPQDKDLILRIARMALSTLDTIKDLQLGESFEPQFISEMTLFAQIAQKRGIPKP